jgi:hypothetical protein
LIERKRVAVGGGEQRHRQLHERHVQLHLREVDRPHRADPAADDVAPRLLAQRLVLPERRPSDTDVRPIDDGAVDVAANAPAGDREAELLAGTVAGAHIEAGAAQPADAKVFKLMTDVEGAHRPAFEVPAVVFWRLSDLVDQLARARLGEQLAAVDRLDVVQVEH